MNVFKNGVKLAGSLIMAAILGIFLCISMNVICSAVFTREIGYTAYVYTDETCEELVTEYQYLYTDNDGDGKDDGKDTQYNEYDEQGYYISKVKQRTTLEGVGKTVFLVLTQVFNFVMVFAFASNTSYKQGFKDVNLVKIGHVKNDMLKGLKIGLIGNIPFFALMLLMAVMAAGLAPAFRTVWYAFLNGHFYSFIIWITGGVQTVAELNAVQYALLALLQFIVPAISAVAYVLGFKEINLTEKIMYKKEV